jgi:ubiquinone/menaquinone biosynthesis C-methylase UbiE
MDPLAEVVAYYERFAEESRLTEGPSRLEFERTKELLLRILPQHPCRIVDVGGAAGAYSTWLASLGHEVHLVDAAPRLIDEAHRRNANSSKRIASLSVADARALQQPDDFADVVLVMGPLYHLTEANDRLKALGEARRILRPSGRIAVAAISRYASALDGLARNLTVDPAFVRIRDRDLRDGQHRNDTDRPDYFTTAYFHRPEDLVSELETSGFTGVRVFGIEGPAWILADFDARWNDPASRNEIMTVARALESEPAIIAASAHLLATGTKGGEKKS